MPPPALAGPGRDAAGVPEGEDLAALLHGGGDDGRLAAQGDPGTRDLQGIIRGEGHLLLVEILFGTQAHGDGFLGGLDREMHSLIAAAAGGFHGHHLAGDGFHGLGIIEAAFPAFPSQALLGEDTSGQGQSQNAHSHHGHTNLSHACLPSFDYP